MQKLPNAEIYKLEMQFMPWGLLAQKVAQKVINDVKRYGVVADLMCGPGFLLEKIYTQRPDLKLFGVDLDSSYTAYASITNPNIHYLQADIRTFEMNEEFDCVLCTGGLHHLPYVDQPRLFAKMSSLLKEDGFCICAEPCIGEYTGEIERKLAVAELGYEYLKAIIKNGAPPSIIDAAVDILHNDVLEEGEYKVTLTRLVEMARSHFPQVTINKTWSESSVSYGDYWLILKK